MNYLMNQIVLYVKLTKRRTRIVTGVGWGRNENTLNSRHNSQFVSSAVRASGIILELRQVYNEKGFLAVSKLARSYNSMRSSVVKIYSLEIAHKANKAIFV